MKKINVKAQIKNEAGKSGSRKLRRANRIPGIVYGVGDNYSITVDHDSFVKDFQKHHFSSIYELDLDGKTVTTIIKDIQYHPVSSEILHIDFMSFEAGKSITVKVPIQIVDREKSPGIKDGGTIVAQRKLLPIDGMPDLIPESVKISVAKMSGGETRYIRDISLSDGLSCKLNRNYPIITMLGKARTIEEEAEEAAAAEAAEAAEAVAEA